MERSVSLIRSGAGGGPAGLVGTAADDAVAAKKDSLETMGGEDAPRAGVIVANHLSYLDILLLGAATPCVFVAKSEIRRWPLLGWLATGAGSLFIDRNQRSEAQAVGERMLELTVPYVDAWNAWFSWTGNRPEGIEPLRAKVDAACAAAGRKPDDVERTVAVLVRLPGATGRGEDDPSEQVPPLEGTPEAIADGLRAYARQGINHVQLVIDPITEASLEALGPVLENLGKQR